MYENQARKALLPKRVPTRERFVIARLESKGFAREFWGSRASAGKEGWVEHVHLAARYVYKEDAEAIACGLVFRDDAWAEVWRVVT